MKKEGNINEVVALLKKIQLAPNTVTRAEKKNLKKYLDDPAVFLRALELMGNSGITGVFPDIALKDDEPHIYDGAEERIAQNYIELSYFVLDKMRENGIEGLDDIKGLKALIEEDTLTIFALTPTPVKIDFSQYIFSDHPMRKEKMMEIEALESDIITFGDKDISFAKIKALIEAGIPDEC